MRKIIFIAVAVLILFTACKKDKTDNDAKEEINVPTIRIPLVTWGGYAALFAANNGSDPTEDSLFFKYGKFKVELIQEENPSLQLQGFANNTYPIIWSTLDMIPLHYESLSRDTRTVPKVIGLFDYSAGGDGIIVRGDIKDGNDLKGKKIVTAQYTPSHFYILWYLDKYGLTTKDVSMVYAADAIAAKDTYVADKSIDVCVTWSPFIYDITDETKETYVPGSVLLSTTVKGDDSYGLIADVYLARADFIENNPDIIEAFTKAMIEGYDVYLQNKERTAAQIEALFGLPEGEAMAMFGDVTIGNKTENKNFFDKSNKFSAHNLCNKAIELYKKNDNILPADFNLDPELIISSDFMMKTINN